MEEKCPKCGSTNFSGTGTDNGYIITCADCNTVIIDTTNELDASLSDDELMVLLDDDNDDEETIDFECEDCKL